MTSYEKGDVVLVPFLIGKTGQINPLRLDKIKQNLSIFCKKTIPRSLAPTNPTKNFMENTIKIRYRWGMVVRNFIFL